jgi:hypothetical protein
MKINLKPKLTKILKEQISREYDYLKEQDVGSDEYNASMKRLNELESKLADIQKSKSVTRLEYTKVLTGLGVSCGGFVLSLIVLKFEETNTLRSALKGVVQNFIPKNKL